MLCCKGLITRNAWSRKDSKPTFTHSPLAHVILAPNVDIIAKISSSQISNKTVSFIRQANLAIRLRESTPAEPSSTLN